MVYTSTKTIGQLGEDSASDFLIHRNYRIIHRNFHMAKVGEFDIIAEKRHGIWPFFTTTVVFVEVKAGVVGVENSYFNPELHITDKKRNNLIRMAKVYISNNYPKPDLPWRIDVIAVDIDRRTNSIVDIRHHENAIYEE